MRTCDTDGCNDKHEARGLCRRHYARLMRRGLPPLDGRRCTVDGCNQKHRAKGLCNRHYSRHRDDVRNGVSGNTECIHGGCKTAPMGGGKWCYRHWAENVIDKRGRPRRCGTIEGRERHQRRGEPLCVRCERATWDWIDVMLEAA